MKKTNIVLLVFIATAMTSCSLSKFLQGMQAERFSLNRHTDISRLINTEGVFFPERADFTFLNFLFFEDSSWGSVFFHDSDFFPDMEDPQVHPGMDLQQSVVTWGKIPSFVVQEVRMPYIMIQ